MRVHFLHPDLGIGGAERLVVDAALAARHSGHAVTVYTSHHDVSHCFPETKSGAFGNLKFSTLKLISAVHVYGDWLPRAILGGCAALCAYVRMVYLAICVCLLASESAADVFFVDQVSVCVPVLRLLRPRARVVFYCHFPGSFLEQK